MSKEARWKDAIAPAMVFAALLVAWEFAGEAGFVREVFFPRPTRILETFLDLVRDGTLARALVATGGRFGVGLLCGGFLGAALGLLMGSRPALHNVLYPFIAAIYPIPKIAIFPLLLVVFGLGETSKYVVVSLSAFFPMLITCLAGVRQINNVYLEVARNYGARGPRLFGRVLFPGSLPSLLAGLRLAANTAFVVTISVEIVAAQAGMGVLLWYGWQTLRVVQIYAALIAIAGTGLLLSFLIDRLTRIVVPWMGE